MVGVFLVLANAIAVGYGFGFDIPDAEQRPDVPARFAGARMYRAEVDALVYAEPLPQGSLACAIEVALETSGDFARAPVIARNTIRFVPVQYRQPALTWRHRWAVSGTPTGSPARMRTGPCSPFTSIFGNRPAWFSTARSLDMVFVTRIFTRFLPGFAKPVMSNEYGNHTRTPAGLSLIQTSAATPTVPQSSITF